MTANEMYALWKKEIPADSDLSAELEKIGGDEKEIYERFCRSLEFGTGGLRGVLGVGTNRMNLYTVAQATQGLADYLNSAYKNASVAVAHDSRLMSDEFAHEAARVLAANGIKVYFFGELVPTPVLSFAVRELDCKSGIVITASHNPAKYNGYKCYDPRGYQMTDEAAAATYGYIKKTDIFSGVKRVCFDEAEKEGKIEIIGDALLEKFYSRVLTQVLDPEACKASDIKVIYSPLNGTGNKPVRTVLAKMGIKNVRVVPEQELPDGNFPTCPFPNPEIKQVFECALKMTESFPADLILATDPDCDRVGIAVPDGGEYKLLSGNEVGVLLSEYVLSRRKEMGTLPEKPVLLKSFVTTSMVDAVAAKHGAEVVDVLTGFKYIGEYITVLESKGEADRFVLGMEESYGYLSGTHARDKDAVVASALIVEMAAYYHSRGKSLYTVMQELYAEYGMYYNDLINIAFEGADGMDKMKAVMDSMRTNPPKTVGGLKVLRVSDFLTSVATDTDTGAQTAIKLPKSNVLYYLLENSCRAIARPSGTEPKLKIYVSACDKNKEKALAVAEKIGADMKSKVI